MNDTIAAISSAGGPIGLIRASGEQAIQAVDTIFRAKNGKRMLDAPGQKLVYGTLHDKNGKMIDCCYAVVFHAPHTYTGESMAELQCHGSTAVLQQALDALFAQGVRQAEAGEFTRRAFLNGKLGLSEAEAVHDLITARTAEAAQNAVAQMMGAVGSPVQQMREELIGMVAHFHAVVDFPDEDIDPILFDDAAALLHRTTSRLYAMAESYERGRILREGVPCVILGRPNAGKSTLLNTLLGRERAIVTDIPGTTRDLIEENVKVGQLLLRVTDTAGLRDTTDPIEQAGIDRAMAEASASALILAVFDGSQPIGDEDMLVLARAAGHRAIAVVNKVDLPQQLDEKLLKKHFLHIVPLSAKTGTGMDKLLSLIPRTIGLGDGAFDGALITNARQAAALARAAERCEAALYAAQSGMTPDAVVMDAEGAIAALGEITGETVTEAVVSRIFSDFCVGK
ncbi:tRNA uridine-5-carboxymethylaminomethyl(34) synthesis GTPase MnmE [uncultured Agathobaculum sp.]|uniref:tRNA uridine-5-carboxymethylaminomethyl(34) synthesis GTPase MnmE n=1 Tax=uncultured Agathobaculum sp. TaxID=2048140 RepID=UPI00320A5D60